MRLPAELPRLSGRWLTAYRILWSCMFAVALIGLTAGTWVQFREGVFWDKAFYGAGIRQSASDNRIHFSPISSEARAAGIAANSTLLAVEGQAVPVEDSPASSDRIARALAGPDGGVLRLTMRAPNGSVAIHQVRRGPHHLIESDRNAPMAYDARIILYLVTNLAMMVPLLAAAALLFARRARDPVVALLSLGFVLQVAQVASFVLPFEWREPYIKIVSPLSGGAIWLAILTFPTGRFEPRWSLLAVPLLLALMTGNLWAPTEFQLSAAVGLPLFGLLAIITLAAIVVRYRRLSPGIERQQVKWAMLGFAGLILFMLASLGLGLLDRLQTDDRVHFLALILNSLAFPAGFLAVVGGLLISLLRYRLYDADVAISRSAVFAALTVSLIALFAGTEELIEILGARYFGGSIGAASGVLAAAVAAVMIAPLHKWMSDWAERRFQRNLIRLRRDLPRLAADLRETSSTARLAEKIVERIVADVRVSRAAFVLEGNNRMRILCATCSDSSEVRKWLRNWHPPEHSSDLECDRGDALYPLRVPLSANETGRVGWILLGPRPDGSLYGRDERDALVEIADPLARAIVITMRRDAIECARKRESQSIARRVAALEAAVERLVTGSLAKPA